MSGALIVKKLWRTSLVVRLYAVHRAACKLTAPLVIEREFRIVCYEQVEHPIAIVIEPSRAGRPLAGVFYTCRLGHIRKSPVAIVMKQRARRIARYVEVGPAIVVIIGGGDTHAVKRKAIDSGFFRDILEAAVSEVPVQSASNWRPAPVSRSVSTVHEIQIQIAVAIEVQEAHPAGCRFDQISSARFSIEMRPSDASLRSHGGEEGAGRIGTSDNSKQQERCSHC